MESCLPCLLHWVAVYIKEKVCENSQQKATVAEDNYFMSAHQQDQYVIFFSFAGK